MYHVNVKSLKLRNVRKLGKFRASHIEYEGWKQLK